MITIDAASPNEPCPRVGKQMLFPSLSWEESGRHKGLIIRMGFAIPLWLTKALPARRTAEQFGCNNTRTTYALSEHSDARYTWYPTRVTLHVGPYT